MNHKFDKIIVISYVANWEKQKRISKLLKNLNIDFEFVYGIDAYNISNMKAIQFDDPANCIYNDLENGKYNDYYVHGISCCIAHLTAIELAYSQNCKNVLILEDDIFFNNDLNIVDTYLNNYPVDADVIQYGYINHSREHKNHNNRYNELYNKNDYLCNGTQCYAICNRKTMKIYLDHIKKHFMAIDQIHWIDNFVNLYNLNVYCAIEPICIDLNHIENISNLDKYKEI